jgi:hypothetical protein
MEIYSVGYEELCESDLEELRSCPFKWVVYDYESTSYDGIGDLVMLKHIPIIKTPIYLEFLNKETFNVITTSTPASPSLRS